MRPVVVDVVGADGKTTTYHVHKGSRPGLPLIYRWSNDHAVRVKYRDRNDPEVVAIAKALREGVDKRKAAEAYEKKRRAGWWFRFTRWFGRLFGKAWYSTIPTWRRRGE